MRLLAVAAVLMAGACAFSSERELFAAGAGAHPIADGAAFEWRQVPDDGETMQVTFHRDGHFYRIEERAHPGEPLRVLLAQIVETPEDDYVVQLHLRSDDETTLYAFLWRTQQGWRAFVDPAGGGTAREIPNGASAFCAIRSYNECAFSGRAELIAYYRALIYPRFVAGAAAPGAYLDLVPAGAARQGPPAKPSP